VGYVVERADQSGRIRYMAMFRDIKGQVHSAGTFHTSAAAEKAWQREEHRQQEGRLTDPSRGRQTLRRYVQEEWFAHHMIEATTRQSYSYLLDRYILPSFGGMKMREIMPIDVRRWVLKLQDQGVSPWSIRQCKVILDAVFTTALNDLVIRLHPGKGVRTPPVPRKVRRIITAAQFDAIYDAMDNELMQLLVETEIESGLRWGELTELRPKDLDLVTGMLVVSRAVVVLHPKFHPDGGRFLVKDYPKDNHWRQLRLGVHALAKLAAHIEGSKLGPEDLIFQLPQDLLPTRRREAAKKASADARAGRFGLTEPNAEGRTYRHGSLSAYAAGQCRCDHCRRAMATYRASRRDRGMDLPRGQRRVDTEGHIPAHWFRNNVWNPAVSAAGIGFPVRIHDLRHAHASWLLSGGADIQVVRDRLGHGSITTTEKYLHTLPGNDDSALAALDKIRGRAVV
jgi:integrase